jgi:hypothetical protein
MAAWLGPGAGRCQLGLRHDQVELGESPFANRVAAAGRAVRRLDLEAAEVLATELEFVDHDVEGRHACRRLVEQALDALSLALGKIEAREPRIDPSRARPGRSGAAPRRPVLDVTVKLVGIDIGPPQAAVPRQAGGDVAEAARAGRQFAEAHADVIGHIA